MKIIEAYPPNIEEIKKKFEIRKEDRIIFTYGDAIYNPHGGTIGAELMAHEIIHSEQQGDYPEKWWKKYLADPKFRLEQEILAYRRQYREFIKTTNNRQEIFEFVDRIARDLSGHIYGNIINYFDAVLEIKK